MGKERKWEQGYERIKKGKVQVNQTGQSRDLKANIPV